MSAKKTVIIFKTTQCLRKGSNMNTEEIKHFVKKCHLGVLPTFDEKTTVPEWFYNLVTGISETNLLFVRDSYLCLNKNTDMIKVRQEFMIHILQKNNTYYDIQKFKDIYKSNEAIIQLWRVDPTRKKSEAWSAARSAAWSATESAARSAVWLVAESAAYTEMQQSLITIIKENSNNIYECNRELYEVIIKNPTTEDDL